MSHSAGELLATLRVAEGLTQVQLADQAGVSQAALSKLENGTVALDQERATRFANIFGVAPHLFEREFSDEVRVFHRKQASLPISADKQLRARAALLLLHTAALFDGSLPQFSFRRRPLPEDGFFDAADVARLTREDLGLGNGPIEDMVGLLEHSGCLVYATDLGSVKVDAIATWPRDAPPLILIDSAAPADRQRFTLAHELGHAVMHHLPGDRQESEADEFASEFLMPAATIRSELRGATLPSLIRMKERWKVSVAALGRRARDLGAMSESDYRAFNVTLSMSGMKKIEPIELPSETPRLIEDLIQRRRAAGATDEQIAKVALLSPAGFRRYFLKEAA